MSTPKERIGEILREGIEALDERGDLTKTEFKDAMEFLAGLPEEMFEEDPEPYPPEVAQRLARMMAGDL